MSKSHTTPGVYVEEVSGLPLSVLQAASALPVFIGYTQHAVVDGSDYHAEGGRTIKPVKIASLLDYETYFGGPSPPTTLKIKLNPDHSVAEIEVDSVNLLYESVRLYFANGGGSCYIVSVGTFNNKASEVKKEKLLEGLASLETRDDITLVSIPESVHLEVVEAGEVHATILAHCNNFRNRFAVLDLVNGDKERTSTLDPITDFRTYVGVNYLKHGAAYYPWIETTYGFKADFDSIINGEYLQNGSSVADLKSLFNSEIIASIDHVDRDIATKSTLDLPASIKIQDYETLKTFAEAVYAYSKTFYNLTLTADPEAKSAKKIHQKLVKPSSKFHKLVQQLYDYSFYGMAANSNAVLATPAWEEPLLALDAFSNDFNGLDFRPPSNHQNDIYLSSKTASKAARYFKSLRRKVERLVVYFYGQLEKIRRDRIDVLLVEDAVYSTIASAIENQHIILPPSGAILGIYATIDRERGVWKAPANVSIIAVKGPVVSVSHRDQEFLNIDTIGGKSVNAIRYFIGKGTLVWGARTLAGNDNEWRYIPVRRFFDMVTASVENAVSLFVFEPNDANTWLKVKAMVENFLHIQWRLGAMAGVKPEHAYYVRVGLGQTMTAQDIIDGNLIIEIGMAVLRPAEFVIFRIKQKLQPA